LAVLIAVGTPMLSTFDQSGPARMKRLWYKMTTRSLAAATDLSCRSLVESLISDASA
jgi:hypothetical protein